MAEERREFTVIFTDGARKTFTADDVTTVYTRALSFLLTLKKDVRVESIIDDKTAKIYGDFVWDLSFSEKEKAFVTGSQVLCTQEYVNALFVEYALYVGGNTAHADDWIKRKLLIV